MPAFPLVSNQLPHLVPFPQGSTFYSHFCLTLVFLFLRFLFSTWEILVPKGEPKEYRFLLSLWTLLFPEAY